VKKILVSILFVLFASPIFAQSAFEGFYGQIATGYQSTNVSSQSYTVTFRNPPAASVNSPSVNINTVPIMLGLGYNFSVTPKFVLGIGAEYQAISSSATSTPQTVSPAGACGGTCPSVKYKVSNQYSLFVTPGYAIDRDKLVYLKAGYASQKLQGTYQQGVSGDIDNGASFGTSTVSGYILGLGYKQVITGGLYGFAETNYYSYGRASLNNSLPAQPGGSQTLSGNNPSSSTYNFLVGVGYKF
jgi:opacity protein-like surface antigen